MARPQTYGEWIKATMERKGLTSLVCCRRAVDENGHPMQHSQWNALMEDEPKKTDGSLPQRSGKVAKRVALGLGVSENQSRIAAGLSILENLPDAVTTRNKHTSEKVARLTAFYEAMGEDDQNEFLQIAEIKWRKTNAEMPDLPDIEDQEGEQPVGNYLAINLDTGALLAGVEPPRSWSDVVISPDTLREIITRLVMVQSHEMVSAHEFERVMRGLESLIPANKS